MPPKRAARRTANTPTPGTGRAQSPSVTGSMLGTDLNAFARSPMVAKYSTSYGSPISQLPDRAAVKGGGKLTQVAANIFDEVQSGNRAAKQSGQRQLKTAENITKAIARSTPEPVASRAGMKGDSEEEEDKEEVKWVWAGDSKKGSQDVWVCDYPFFSPSFFTFLSLILCTDRIRR